MIIVVTGYRYWQHWEVVDRVLEWHLDFAEGDLAVGVGDCPTGADLFVRMWCEVNHVPYREWVAPWISHGKAAGPIRNQDMINRERPARVIAFLHHLSRGALGTARYATRNNIPLLEVWP